MTSDGVNSYTWDRANRLLTWDNGVAADLVNHAYDGEGRRVSQAVGTTSPTITKYLLDIQPGLSVVLSQTEGSDVTRFVHAPRGIHARQDATNDWHWTVQDGLGTVRIETDNSVAVEGSQNLDPFGNLIDLNGTIGTPYGFTGELVDGSGLLDLRARRYNAGMGVFASLDPFEGGCDRTMSLNGYSWVEGNVPNAIDPSGMQTCQLVVIDGFSYLDCGSNQPTGGIGTTGNASDCIRNPAACSLGGQLPYSGTGNATIPFTTMPNWGDFPPQRLIGAAIVCNTGLCPKSSLNVAPTCSGNDISCLLGIDTSTAASKPSEALLRAMCQAGDESACRYLVELYLSPRCRNSKNKGSPDCAELLKMCNDGKEFACGRVRSQCSDDRLTQLEADKDAICKKTACKPTYQDPKTGINLETPCKALVDSIIRAAQCRSAREEIIRDCYQGNPDKSHGYGQYFDATGGIVKGQLGQVFDDILKCAGIFYDRNRKQPCNPNDLPPEYQYIRPGISPTTGSLLSPSAIPYGGT